MKYVISLNCILLNHRRSLCTVNTYVNLALRSMKLRPSVERALVTKNKNRESNVRIKLISAVSNEKT